MEAVFMAYRTSPFVLTQVQSRAQGPQFVEVGAGKSNMAPYRWAQEGLAGLLDISGLEPNWGKVEGDKVIKEVQRLTEEKYLEML